MLIKSTVLVLALVPFLLAAAPPPGSEDALIMGDFVEWVVTQHAADGQWCCNLSDGRPLMPSEVREREGRLEIFYSRRHWAGAPQVGIWLPVPEEVILRAGNPVGFPIAWVMFGHIYCFADSTKG